MCKYQFRTTVLACEADHSSPWVGNYKRLLERRFDGLAEAIATKLMGILQRISKAIFNARENTWANCAALVFDSLMAPISKAHTFLFEFFFIRQQCRMR